MTLKPDQVDVLTHVYIKLRDLDAGREPFLTWHVSLGDVADELAMGFPFLSNDTQEDE